ncbi:hypothetical protein ACFV1C_20765 [Streptomyces sp. NPDC059605]
MTRSTAGATASHTRREATVFSISPFSFDGSPYGLLSSSYYY